jgi:cytochrome P450
VLPKIQFRKGDGLALALESIMRDPKQWIEPAKFIPERFDEKSEYYLRPNGQPRHPLAFTPFMGGKRICLGKTFAEITTKFTVPLLYYHFDFDYVDSKHREQKPLYTLGGLKRSHIPLLMKIREHEQDTINSASTIGSTQSPTAF